jgi:hypothetical protein
MYNRQNNVRGEFWIKRGVAVLIAGGVLLLVGLAVIFSSISSLVNMADSLPQISAKDLIKSSLGNFAKGNQTSVRVNLEHIGYTIALGSFGILVGIVLGINSIIAFVAGVILVVYDRKTERNLVEKR